MLGMLFFGAVAAARAADYTLIVAPARYSVMQLLFDVVARNPAVMVSYQAGRPDAEPLLHAWNGTEWVAISLTDFRELSFVQEVPKRTVLIGDDATLPAAVREAATWSRDRVQLTTLGNAALASEFGRLFKWPASEWKWFAARYNLKLQDESEPLRKSSWYDQQGPLPRQTAPKVIREVAPAENVTPAPQPKLPPAADQGAAAAVPVEAAVEATPAEVKATPVSEWNAPAPVAVPAPEKPATP